MDDFFSADPSASIECRPAAVYFDQRGLQCRRQAAKKTGSVTLGRDHRGLLGLWLRIDENEVAFTTEGAVSIPGDGIRQGRVSIHLRSQAVTVQITKADPERLHAFCKLLAAKLRASLDTRKITSDSPPTTLAKRKYARRPLGFVQLSPMTASQRPADSPEEKRVKSHVGRVSAARLSAVRSVLSEEQRGVLDIVLSGKSIFFTGNAGTGKTYLLKQILDVLPRDSTVATASTGVAACATGGMTLHAFAGVSYGSKRMPLDTRRWLQVKTLIIDEISMLDGRYFDQLEKLARRLRGSRLPFGGIQLILVGDFLQLPPVTRPGEERVFAFQADSWDRCVQRCVELKEIHRQADPVFAGLLRRLRMGKCSDEDFELIQSTRNRQLNIGDIVATKLCTHVREADAINERQLSRLTTASKTFRARDKGGASDRSKIISRSCRAAETLVLKVGAQVMLVKNLDVAGGLANGSRGVVTGFDQQDRPIVAFTNGREETIRQQDWEVKTPGGASYSRHQLPLQLAWAISIHKSQGMSLDAVDVSLANVFEAGQAYVALSRARSLEGLRVREFSRGAVRADAEVLNFYQDMQEASSSQA